MRRALPPVGWHRTVEHEPQRTTVWACEKTVVMLKQPIRSGLKVSLKVATCDWRRREGTDQGT